MFRYMLLCTHYRRPIDFSDEVVAAAGKGMATFARLAERIERLTGGLEQQIPQEIDQVAGALLESEVGTFVRDAVAAKMRFLERMDDDFNTADAIAVLHEMAGSVNSFLERTHAEADRPADVVQAATAAHHTIRKLGRVLGLFRQTERMQAARTDDLDKIMRLVIELRDEARKSKNFALSDRIRDGLKERGFVIEDRPDGTGWRKA